MFAKGTLGKLLPTFHNRHVLKRGCPSLHHPGKASVPINPTLPATVDNWVKTC